MNLVADEGVDRTVVERLRREGHDVAYVDEMSSGVSDDEVLGEANRRGAALVTADKDFGELVYRRRLVHAGVLLLRLTGLGQEAKSILCEAAVRKHGPQMIGSFSVLSPGGLRIRPRVGSGE